MFRWTICLTCLVLAGCAGARKAAVGSVDSTAPAAYTRILRPDAETVSLQIALRQFKPAHGIGPDVWLVAASHIGESNYFAQLQRRLETAGLVLFEGVGAKSKHFQLKSEDQGSVQHTMAASLGLVFQLEAVNYDRPHFRNSDLTLDQLQRLMESGPSDGGVAGDEAGAREEFAQLLQVMDGSSALGMLVQVGLRFIGSSAKLRALTRVALIEILGGFQGDMSRIKGLPPSVQRLLTVIIQERNKVVMADLTEALQTVPPPRSVAVFYGAGHMADLEQRLRGQLHYRPRSEHWLTVMSVNNRHSGLSGAEVDSVRKLILWQLEAMRGAE